MTTISFLTSEDFQLEGGKLYCGGPTSGVTFVFFYSTNCPHCGPVKSIFNAASSQFPQGSCRFGIINVSQNPRVIDMARSSNTPIRFVPLILAYFKGQPIAQFSSQNTLPNLVGFIRKCFSAVQSQMDSFGETKEEEPEIPKYALGVPYCDGDVCYVSYDDAYKK